MAPQRTITELAELIQAKTKMLTDGLQGQSGADFSLAFSLPPPPTINLSASQEATRGEILEAADELKARLLGPFGYLGSLALPVPALIVILDSIHAFDIPSHVPTTPGSSITYDDLAEA